MAIWSFKCKRKPDGFLLKHKVRLWTHGGQQIWGDSYWETYSPVVNMLTVQLLLSICKIHNLQTKAIDFVLTFPQAELKEDSYMMIPVKYEAYYTTLAQSKHWYILKLNWSLYGLKQASLNWYKTLQTALQTYGFQPSKIDPCLYIDKDVILLSYVDDCIIVIHSINSINKLIISLWKGQ